MEACLLSIQNDKKLYALYEVFSGTKLLDHDYESIKAGKEYVYARKGDEWEVFRLIPLYL